MIASTTTVILLGLSGTGAVAAGLAMGLTRRRDSAATHTGVPSGKILRKR